MIKKVIFDIDNTLIMSDEDYIMKYQAVLRKYNGNDTYEGALQLYKCIGEYEKEVSPASKESLLEFINNYYGTSYSMDIVIDILDAVSTWYKPLDDNLIDALDYLSEKYELYVLTNWFTECQKKRLDKVGITHYFKEIIGPERYVKPQKESFEYFCNDVEASECVVIGDRIDIDIDIPLKLGMRALLYDYKNRYQDLEYESFNNWNQIKNLL